MKIKLFTIPNIITLSNLLCGAGSIIASLVYEDLTMAFVLIMAAAVCDFFDGFTARALKQWSEIGVQLDSLADMVSFGTAPAAVLYALCGYSPSMIADFHNGLLTEATRFLPFMITAFSALRLAKFNIDETQHEEFCGLTTTANAIFCGSFAMMIFVNGLVVWQEWVIAIAAVMSALLVSPIRMFSFKIKSYGWKGNEVRWPFVVFAVLAVVLLRTYSIPVIIVMYIVVSTVIWIVKKLKVSKNTPMMGDCKNTPTGCSK